MNRLLILPAALLTLAGCNEKTGLDLTVTAESEPNDLFSDADNLGSVSSDSDPLSVSASIEFDDGTNTDLQDHYIVLANFSGTVSVDLTPTDVAADLILVEEISESTDGVTFNDSGAGVPESGTFTVSNGVAFRFRVEVDAADTDYTIAISPVASVSAPVGESNTESSLLIDPTTGEARLELIQLDH